MKFRFYIKKNGEHKIFLSVTHNSKRKRIATGFNISDPDNWDKDKQRVKRKEPGYKSINMGLQALSGKLVLIKNQMTTNSIATGQAVSLYEFMKRYKGEPEKGFWERWKQFKREKVNSKSDSTINTYNSTELHLKSFEEKDGELTFRKMNLSFYSRFVNYLSGHVVKNSMNLYISKLKGFLNYCYNSGWIESDRGWKMWKATTYRPEKEGVYYTLAQLTLLGNMELKKDQIRDCVFSIDELDKIRSVFMFQCLTGIRQSDLKQIQDLEPSFTGIIYLDNIKADRRRKIFLVEKSKDLFYHIKSFEGFKIDRYRYNYGLTLLAKQFGWEGKVKHRGKMVEKWKAFTSHSARYTFISILSNHAPGMIVKGLADHADLKTTEGYFLQNEEEMQRAMKKAFG